MDNVENKIDYIEIPATDVAASKAFFSALFGWEFQDYGPEYCSFADGRVSGGFYRTDKRASTDNGSVLIVFYAKALKEIETKVKSLGGTIVKETFEFPGGRRFHFTDPCRVQNAT